MVVKIAPYNKGVYNAEGEETEVIDYRIIARLNEPAEAIVTIADPTGARMQKYNVASGAVGGAVADDGGAETDETTEANEDTADDMTLLPAAPALNDAYYFGFSGPFNAVQLDISTVAEAVGFFAITWEYSTGADAWTALSGVTDGTNKYQNAGVNTIDWTIPDDWATDEVGAIADLYWVRGRLTDNAAWTVVPLAKQAWIGGVFIGPGRLTIENPASTDIFDGRILKAPFNQGSNTVQLMCKDWLSQLDDPIITYDMREPIDGGGLRESVAHSDPNGAFVDVAENDGGTLYFYDDGDYDDADGWDWANDQFNGKRLVFTTGMAGKRTWRFFPYEGVPIDEDTYDDTPEAVWNDDGLDDVCSADNDFILDYNFRVFLGNNTPSDFYVHDSIAGARLYVRYQVGGGANNHSHLRMRNKFGGHFVFTTLEEDDHFVEITYTLNSNEASRIVDSDGIATVRFDVDRAGGTASIAVSYMYLEIDVQTVGYSLAVTIIDTIAPNKLEVATDLTAAATRIWEEIPYAIVQEVFKHIDTAEGGTLVSDYDVLVPLTAAANIEHTSGFSTRRYENSTPLAVIQDLANIDRTALYIPIGTTALTWKSTFNDGAPTAMTDASVIRWGGERSFVDVRNGLILYGPKINDNLLRLDTKDITGGDPGADSKSTYGVSRYKVVKNAGVNTEYELSALGSALVERDEDVLLFLNCDIAGLSALRLGDEVSITSTYMNLAAAKYVITYWEYSYSNNITQLRLHPRLSTKGFVQHVLFSDSIRRLANTTEHLSADVNYIPSENAT